MVPPPLSIPSDHGCGSSNRSSNRGGSSSDSCKGRVLCPANPALGVAVDSHSRKPLYMICTASVPAGEQRAAVCVCVLLLVFV
jgi:hypothetical protein